MEELQNSLEKMKKNIEATGPDGIKADLSKYNGGYLSNTLLNFVNRVARVPRTWYEAHVISVFKKGMQNL
jgi:hypothetical protein